MKKLFVLHFIHFVLEGKNKESCLAHKRKEGAVEMFIFRSKLLQCTVSVHRVLICTGGIC